MQQPVYTGQVVSIAVAFSTKVGTTVQVTVGATGQVIQYEGTLIDPSVVVLTLVDPNNSSTIYTYGVSTVLKDAVGVYYASLLLTIAGTYKYKFAGDPGTTAAKIDEGTIIVLPSPV